MAAKPLFNIDPSIKAAALQAKADKAAAKAAKAVKPKITLEEALATLKSLGFSITPPTTHSDMLKHEASLEKLGLVDTTPKRTAETAPATLTLTLGTMHVVAGNTYGPGTITLPIEQKDLYNALIQQDQLSRRAHMDTTVFSTQSRCYIIDRGSSDDKNNKFHKREVSEVQFNSDNAFESHIAITAGKGDMPSGVPLPSF